MSSPARSAEPVRALAEHPDAVTENLAVSSHVDPASHVSIWFAADNSMNVDMACSGCLLDVSVRAWRTSSAIDSVEAPGSARVDLGHQDVFSFVAADTNAARAFAWDIVVSFDVDSRAVEET